MRTTQVTFKTLNLPATWVTSKPVLRLCASGHTSEDQAPSLTPTVLEPRVQSPLTSGPPGWTHYSKPWVPSPPLDS